MLVKLNPNFFPGQDTVIISALDPGLSIGCAVGMFGRTDTPGIWDARFTTKVYRFPDDAQALRDVELSLSDVIIVEKWVLFKNKALELSGDDMIGPQAVGFIRGELQIMGKLDKLRFQTPSNKEYVEIEDIRHYFADNYGPTEHQKDAAAHLVYYLQRGKYD